MADPVDRTDRAYFGRFSVHFSKTADEPIMGSTSIFGPYRSNWVFLTGAKH